MEQGFIDILKQLAKEQGNAALTDARKCKALLADYTKNEYKKESAWLVQAVEAGIAKAIEGADDLASCKKAKIRDLEEEKGLSSAVAADIVNTLALVLRGDTTVTISPSVEKAAAEKTFTERASAERAAAPAAPPRPAPAFSETRPVGDISVLIVDDSALMRNLFGHMIEDTPGLVIAEKAMNGKFALDKIPRVNPDIILLDYEMPEMNGIEFLRERKKRGIDIPVIMLLPGVTRIKEEVKAEALPLGVTDFAQRPAGSSSEDIHAIKDDLVKKLFGYGGAYHLSQGKK